MLLSNFYISVNKLNALYRFMANFSLTRLNFEAFILLQYGFDRCKEREFQPILYAMQLEDDDFNRNIIWIAINLVLWRVVALWLLTRRVQPKESNRSNRKLDLTSGNDKGTDPQTINFGFI